VGVARRPRSLGWVRCSRRSGRRCAWRLRHLPTTTTSSVALAPARTSKRKGAFAAWLHEEFKDAPGRLEHSAAFDAAELSIVRWRRRFHGPQGCALWKRPRLIKEVIKSAPIVSAVRSWTRTTRRRLVRSRLLTCALGQAIWFVLLLLLLLLLLLAVSSAEPTACARDYHLCVRARVCVCPINIHVCVCVYV